MPGPPKGVGSLRRAPSSLSKMSTPPTTPSMQTSKSSKKGKVVTLRLSRELLSGLVEKSPVTKSSDAKVKPSPKTSTKPLPTKASASNAPTKSEIEAAPLIKDGDEDDIQSSGKSATGGDKKDSKTGDKREAGAGTEEDGKAKPKPLQRKRPKVGENGRLDGRTTAAKAAGFIASAHKLGPKANQGAINEKLRALDRTGKPCRRWQKTGFKIKSFTGRVWEVPSWHTPDGRSFGSEAETKSDSNEMSKENSSSNVGSESKTPAGGGVDAIVSSPAVPAEV